jgi:hypothetical protein
MFASGGYVPSMAELIARVEMVRTTADGGGDLCDVVTGMGATPELALAKLRSAGEALGQQLLEAKAAKAEATWAAGAAERKAAALAAYDKDAEEKAKKGVHVAPFVWPPRGQEYREYALRPQREGWWSGRFEIVGVRLTPTPEESGRTSWLAYGTLAWAEESQNEQGKSKTG